MGRVEIAAFRVGSRAKEGKVGRRGGGGDGEKKIRTAGYRFSRRSSLSHNTTQFGCPVTNLYQLVRTLETLLEQAVFLGCLPSQVSYKFCDFDVVIIEICPFFDRITNMKFWGSSEAIISKTLQLLSDLSVGYPFLLFRFLIV